MRNSIARFCTLILVALSIAVPAEAGDDKSLGYVSGCEIDINGDRVSDIVFLADTVRGRELIVMIKRAKGYDSYLISDDFSNMYLSCHSGKTVTETAAGEGEKTRKTYKTPGTYIKMSQPEGSSVVYFWDGKKFKEVWTSD